MFYLVINLDSMLRAFFSFLSFETTDISPTYPWSLKLIPSSPHVLAIYCMHLIPPGKFYFNIANTNIREQTVDALRFWAELFELRDYLHLPLSRPTVYPACHHPRNSIHVSSSHLYIAQSKLLALRSIKSFTYYHYEFRQVKTPYAPKGQALWGETKGRFWHTSFRTFWFQIS